MYAIGFLLINNLYIPIDLPMFQMIKRNYIVDSVLHYLLYTSNKC